MGDRVNQSESSATAGDESGAAGDQSPPSAATSPAASVVRPVQRAIGRAWRYLGAALRFYRDNWSTIRTGCKLWFIEYSPTFQDPELLRREIRRSLDDDDDILRNVDGVWHIDLPDRCAVCGGEALGEWIEEERTLLDPYPLIVVPLASLTIGAVLVLWYRSLPLLPLALVAGILGGYASRRQERFVLRLKRCARHVERKKIPELTLFKHQIVLRPGTREVKMAMLREPADPVPGIPTPAPSSPDEQPLPETIPLEEEITGSSSIIFERGKRLPEESGEQTDDDDTRPLI